MSAHVLAFDLGGTDLKAALCTERGEIVAFTRRPSRVEDSAAAPLDAMQAAAEELGAAARNDVRAVGLGCPGAIDPRTGALVDRTAHLPHWRNEPLRDRLRERFRIAAAVDNDANCAALAEHTLGAARGARVSLTVTLGTGVGCGVIVDGHVQHGARGGAGEIGHLPLGSGEVPCTCGIENCVEPEMSGSGLVERARSAGFDVPDAAAVFALAAGGERRAQDLIARMADRLGAALATATNLLDPDVIVIGGGVAKAGETLLDPVRRAAERYTLPSHRRGLRIVAAELGERAGVVGAGLLGWQIASPRTSQEVPR